MFSTKLIFAERNNRKILILRPKMWGVLFIIFLLFCVSAIFIIVMSPNPVSKSTNPATIATHNQLFPPETGTERAWRIAVWYGVIPFFWIIFLVPLCTSRSYLIRERGKNELLLKGTILFIPVRTERVSLSTKSYLKPVGIKELFGTGKNSYEIFLVNEQKKGYMWLFAPAGYGIVSNEQNPDIVHEFAMGRLPIKLWQLPKNWPIQFSPFRGGWTKNMHPLTFSLESVKEIGKFFDIPVKNELIVS